MHAFLNVLIGVLMVNVVIGQVQVPGKYRPKGLQKAGLATFGAVHSLPEQDNEKLLQEALAEEQPVMRRQDTPLSELEEYEDASGIINVNGDLIRKNHPFIFGAKVPLIISMNETDSGEWSEDVDAGTRHWRSVVASKDAVSLSLHFSDFFLAPGAELYILSETEQVGAFTAEVNNKPERIFSIAPLAGEYLVLEYVEPIETLPGTSSLVVEHVVHGFRSSPFVASKAAHGSGSCNINVACPEGREYRDEVNSVAIFLTKGGTGFCTGAMINNSKNNGRQLFLTAYHCIEKKLPFEIARSLVGFKFQYTNCHSYFESTPRAKTAQGLRILAESKESDYAILEVVEAIPDSYNVFMAGWNKTLKNSEELFAGIHHPRGDVKKVSHYKGKLQIARVMGISEDPNFWRVLSWTKGVTEPGSSGSPLFNSKGQIVGHLLGGFSSCDDRKKSDFYGALGRDFKQANPIRPILDPRASGKSAIEGEYLKELRRARSSTDEIDSSDILPTIDSQELREGDSEAVMATVTVTRYVTLPRLTITRTVTARSTPKVDSADSDE